MCVPAAGAIVQGLAFAVSAISTVNTIQNQYKEKESNAKYKAQVALTNMQNARDLAYEQRQTGIEEARKEKIAGIQKASLLMAQSAAGGFSIDSGTNLLNRESIYDSYNSNAQELIDKYNASANKYMNRANGYLNEAKDATKNLKNDLFSAAITGLGKTTSVAQRWYKNGTVF